MKLKALQWLRALAVGLVAYAHAVDLQISFAISRQQSFFHLQDFGAIGVDVFFVVSGFIITLVTNNYVGYAQGVRFLIKRFLRINPLYYLATLILIGLSFVGHIALPHAGMLQSLLIFPIDTRPNKIFPILIVGWTLSFEWLFYILFFVSIVLKSRHKPVFAVTSILLLVFAGCLGHFTNNQLIFVTNPILLEFTLGVLICVAYLRMQYFPKSLAIALVLIAILIYIFEVIYGYGTIADMQNVLNGSQSLLRFLIWGLPSAALVAGCIFLEKENIFIKLWNNKWMQLIGDASYSIYLVHPIGYFALSNLYRKIGFPGIPDLMILFQFAVAMIFGIIFYLLIEKPFLRIIHEQRKVKKTENDNVHCS